MIAGNGTKVGFFGEVTGSLTGVDLRYVTVISTGADAKVGAIAAKATTIASSTAQGHVYTSNNSTVGFLAGETSGNVTDSIAVGYVKVLGSAAINVAVNVVVGSTTGTVSGSYAFVEVNAINDSATVATTGTVTAYADILAAASGALETLRDDILTGYVMKDFYVGSVQAAYTINNYRQLAIIEMYGWATYTLGADIELPFSYGNGVHAGESVYTAIDENGKKIYSSAAGTYMGVTEEVR